MTERGNEKRNETLDNKIEKLTVPTVISLFVSVDVSSCCVLLLFLCYFTQLLALKAVVLCS